MASLYEHEFGATVTVAKRAHMVSGMVEYEIGSIDARGAFFEACGQGGFDDRHCIYFSPGLGSEGARSRVVSSSFDYMLGSAVSVGRGVSGVLVDGVVGYSSLGSMFVVDSGAGAGNAIVNTLSAKVVCIQTHRGKALKSNLQKVMWPNWPANFDIQVKGRFTGNVAAGSERLGFKGWGAQSCSVPETTTKLDPNDRFGLAQIQVPTPWQWKNNEAHGTMIGSASLGTSCLGVSSMCFPSFTAWNNWNTW